MLQVCINKLKKTRFDLHFCLNELASIRNLNTMSGTTSPAAARLHNALQAVLDSAVKALQAEDRRDLSSAWDSYQEVR